MKKSSNASDLAARIAAAAQQPAGTSSVPTSLRVSMEPPEKPVVTKAAPELVKTKKAKPKEPQTIAITLRPDTALWNRFVLKASERTRQEGRVISAQQIMLETLERSDA